MLAGCTFVAIRPGAAQTPDPPVRAGHSPQHAADEDHDPAGAPEQPGAAELRPVTLRAALSQTEYTQDVAVRLVLKIDVAATAAPAPDAKTRPPLNLALVIDSSGSMGEDRKLQYTMESARVIVENLADRDIVSVVAFSDDALVLSPAGRAINKQFLAHRLGEVAPHGWTNFSAGLLEGIAQIDSQHKETADGFPDSVNQTRHIIILTDGKANRGVTDAARLRALVEAAHARGIGMSTMGCGTDFDGKLLADLADAGGGRYTYVKSSEQIPSMMSTELGGLLAVGAQNAELSVKVSDAEITRVFGRVSNRPTREFSIKLGDLREGERGIFILELTPRVFTPGAVVPINVSLVYDRPEHADRRRDAITLSAAYTQDRTPVEIAKDAAVLLHADVLGAMEEAEEAAVGLDLERAKRVGDRFDRLYQEARRVALDTGDQELLNQAFLLKHLMEELAAADQSRLLHAHDEAKAKFLKDADYRRYLMSHHREQP